MSFRFRFRAILDDVNHPEWDKAFWKNSEWTGIIACPFSSAVNGKDPVQGIYFEPGTSAYNGRVHTVMGRDGHRLLANKGEVLRSAILTPDGSPWNTKYKGYTCEIGVVPGHHPHLAKCLERSSVIISLNTFKLQFQNKLENGATDTIVFITSYGLI